MKKFLAVISLVLALCAHAFADDVQFRTYPYTFQSGATTTGEGIAGNVGALSTLDVTVTGTFSATILLEGTTDNATWNTLAATNASTGGQVTSLTGPGLFIVNVAGLSRVRARISAYASGTVTVTGLATATRVNPLALSISSGAAITVDTTTITGGTSSALLWDHNGVVSEIPPINGGGAPAIGWNGSDSLNFNNGAVLNFNTSTGGGIAFYGGGGWGMSTPSGSTLQVTDTRGSGTLKMSGVSVLDGNSTAEGKNFIDPSAPGSLATKNYVDTGGGMVRLSQVTCSGSTSVVSFTSISGAYSALRIVYQARSTDSSEVTSANLTFNSDTAGNYDNEAALANDATASASHTENASSFTGLLMPGSSANIASGIAGSGYAEIPNYAGTSFFKSVVFFSGTIGKPSSGWRYLQTMYGHWRSTSAVTRIDLTASAGNFSSGSVFTLYGMK